MTSRLISVASEQDIPGRLRGTPIEKLLRYHNLDRPHETYASAQLLVGMCMDNRKQLDMPPNFAFIIRTGGANLRYSEFKVSFAVGVGGIKYIALIGHSNCGMVNLASRKEQFIAGLIENGGWSKEAAEEHFYNYAPMFEISNEIDFVSEEVTRLRRRYPKITVVPMLYRTEDNLLYLIKEE